VTGLAVHALHYGLLAAGLVTVGALVRSVRRRRDDGGHDGHDERVRRLRASLHAPLHDERGSEGGPPSAG
jgi:hypothetical protein